LWLHSLKVAQLLRSAACLHTNQSRSYLNHLVVMSDWIRGDTLSVKNGKIWRQTDIQLSACKIYNFVPWNYVACG